MLVSLGCQAGGLARYSPMSGITPRIPPLGLSMSPYPQRDGQIHLRRHLRVERHCFRLCRPQKPRWLGRSSSDRERRSHCDSVSYTPPISGKRAAVWGVSQGLPLPSCCRRPSSGFLPAFVSPAGTRVGARESMAPWSGFRSPGRRRTDSLARLLPPLHLDAIEGLTRFHFPEGVSSGKFQVSSGNCQAAGPHSGLPTYPIIPIFHHSTISVTQADGIVSGTPRPSTGLLDVGKYWRRGEYSGTMIRRNGQGCCGQRHKEEERLEN